MNIFEGWKRPKQIVPEVPKPVLSKEPTAAVVETVVDPEDDEAGKLFKKLIGKRFYITDPVPVPKPRGGFDTDWRITKLPEEVYGDVVLTKRTERGLITKEVSIKSLATWYNTWQGIHEKEVQEARELAAAGGLKLEAGVKVKVLRSSGAMEDDWVIGRVGDDEVMVEKKIDEETKEKIVPLGLLVRWNVKEGKKRAKKISLGVLPEE